MRKPADSVRERLLDEPHRYSLFQAVRLLRREGDVAVVPEASLAFPVADIAGITATDAGCDGRYTINARPLGLYGTSSPLAAHLTETILEEQAADESAQKDFLDVVHRRLYDLLYDCWTRYRLYLNLVEEESPRDADRLEAFAGGTIGTTRAGWLRHLGLFSHTTRTLAGLETLLADIFEPIPVEVVPCTRRTVPIAEEQRCRMGLQGATLGADAFIGCQIDDCQSKYTVRLGPVTAQQLPLVTPGGRLLEDAARAASAYVDEALVGEVEVRVVSEPQAGIVLGACSCMSLGRAGWLIQGGSDGTGLVEAAFELSVGML